MGFPSPTGASLVGATLTVVLGVVSVTLSNAGQYQTAPTVTFSAGGGTGATATAALGNAVEARMLTMIEVLRSYIASCSTSAELYAMRDIIRAMMGRINGGNGTAAFDASIWSAAAQRIGVKKFATQPRSDY